MRIPNNYQIITFTEMAKEERRLYFAQANENNPDRRFKKENIWSSFDRKLSKAAEMFLGYPHHHAGEELARLTEKEGPTEQFVRDWLIKGLQAAACDPD